MADPLSAGTVHDSFICPAPTPAAGATAAVSLPGASGFHAGVAVTVALDGPVPSPLTAATLNRYWAVLINPPTIADVSVETPSSTALHAVPSVDRSTT